MKKALKIYSIVLLATFLAGIIVFAVPTGIVAAASLHDEPFVATPGPQERFAKNRLENQYRRVQEGFAKQAENIVKLGDLVNKTQTRIDELHARGLDTTILVNAVAVFEAQLPAIQSAHDDASAIFSTHAGFDDNAKVTDVAAARQTLESTRAGMKAALDLVKSSVGDLRQALQDFRVANPRPTPVPSLTPEA